LKLVGFHSRVYNPLEMDEHEHGGLLTDEAVLHNIAHGCEDCFDLLFLRFFRPIFNLAYKIIRDRSEAEDVVQDVFLVIHQQRERFDPSVGPARTWVLQFAYYKSLKRRRYLSKRHFYEEHVSVDEDRHNPLMVQPEYVQRSVECKEIVEQALATLTPAQRRVVELLHFEGRTLQEISQMEGKELTGIRNTYYRGVNALRMTFGKEVRPTVIRATEMEKRREEYEIGL
jgi:RNA polymerase sigma-70 factor, ECF subfamily